MSQAHDRENMFGRIESDKAAAIKELLDRCDSLTELGVARLVVAYDGSGDSGETFDAVAFNAQEQEIPLPDKLAEELAEVADNLIPFGYANGNGGEGEIVLDVAARQIRHEHSDYSVESYTNTYDQASLDRPVEGEGGQNPP